MTAVEELRTVRLLADVTEKLTAWEKELAAVPEGIGTAVAEALEASAQRQQAHARTLQQEQTAWREVQERHIATLSKSTDTLGRLIALNEGLVRRYRRALYRLLLVFGMGTLVGAAVTGGTFVYALRSTPAPALHDPPSAETLTASPEQYVQRRQCGASPWRMV